MMDVNISFENPNVDFQIDDLFTLEITAVPGAKGDPGDPATDEQVQTAVDNYLDEHPEIVVEDGSITTDKLADGAVTNVKIADGTITGNKFVPALPITEIKSTSGAKYEQSSTTKLGVTHTALLATSDHYQNAIGAVAFSTTTAYAVGDYVVYNKKTYKCINAHTGAWSASDFEETKVLPRLDAVEESTTQLNSELTAIENGTTAVGTAEQLLSNKYNTDTEPYHFRRTPYDATREMPVIVGGSLGWNQLVDSTSTDSFVATENTTKSFSDGVCTFTASAQKGGVYLPYPAILNHRYLFFADVKATTANTAIQLDIWAPYGGKNYNASTQWTTYAFMVQAGPTRTQRFYIRDNRTEGFDAISVRKVMVFDLTATFGSTIADYIYSLESATAGAGVAWVNRYIDLSVYHAYDAGSIQSVSGLVSHDTTGRNIWGGEAIKTDVSEAISQAVVDEANKTVSWASVYSNGATISRKLPIKANTAYTIIYTFSNTVARTNTKVNYTDGTGTIITTTATGKQTLVFVTDATKTFSHLSATNSDGTTVLYYEESGIFEGVLTASDFKPYVKHTYALDPTITLRGVPKLDSNNDLYFDGDIWLPDGTINRKYGMVDLGSLAWVKGNRNNDNTGYVYYINYGTLIKNPANSICSKLILQTNTSIAWEDTKVGNYVTTGTYIIAVWDVATAAEFKTAMNGVYLVYELATTTTETATPYTAMQLCDGYGTEEYITTSVVPVGHSTRYPINQVAKLDGLPSDFSTLIAPTERTYMATRNYTSGSLLIVDNVLYKATANIANGGTLTPNTNITATTLAEVISALA